MLYISRTEYLRHDYHINVGCGYINIIICIEDRVLLSSYFEIYAIAETYYLPRSGKAAINLPKTARYELF